MFWQPKINYTLTSRDEDLVVEAGTPRGMESRGYVGQPLKARQFFLVGSLVVLCVLALGVRAFALQIIQGDTYRDLSESNSFRRIIIPAPRGIIYDQYGRALTENYPEFALALIPSEIPTDQTERTELFKEVSRLSNLPTADLEVAWQRLSPERRRQLDPVILDWPISNLDGLKMRLAARNWSGLDVITLPRRRLTAAANPTTSWSHLLGYVGKVGEADLNRPDKLYLRQDIIGKNGLELSYEKTLKGTNGERNIEINALGEEQLRFKENPAVPGRNIWLTVDSELQAAAESALIKQLDRAQAKRGAVVVQDVKTGGILTLVSLPSFDSNAFNRGLSVEEYNKLQTDPDHPLFNRVVQGTYPSGSTIKPVIAAAALQEGIIQASTSFSSSGGISVGAWFFPDWKAGGHGVTDVRKALAQSVNTFFYIIGGGFGDFRGLGMDNLVKYAKLFGLGQLTGIDLPGEASGFFPTVDWKNKTKNEPWYIGDTYHVSIGQGDVLVTPLQVAGYTAAIANGGTFYRPHLVGEIASSDDGQSPQKISPQVVSQKIIDANNLEIIRQGLRQTVVAGSAQYLADLPMTVAGKTGTAEVGGEAKTHAWFTGFAPYEQPQIAITVLLENAGEGSGFAVPAAKDILKWWADNRLAD